MVHNRCNKLSYELYELLIIGDNEGCQQISNEKTTTYIYAIILRVIPFQKKTYVFLVQNTRESSSDGVTRLIAWYKHDTIIRKQWTVIHTELQKKPASF